MASTTKNWTFEHRLIRRIEVMPNGCWRWTGRLDHGGYGQIKVDGVNHTAHRYAYINLVGPVPEGHDLDHLCRNRWCACPQHLEPVTHKENIRRGMTGKTRSNRTHCSGGHLWDASNSRYNKRILQHRGGTAGVSGEAKPSTGGREVKTIIAGMRDFNNIETLSLAMLNFNEEVTEVISGCANGVDKLGELWASVRGIPVKRFPADWQSNGKAAGPIRNREMAKYAEALVAIWDGQSRGTKNMIEEATKRGLLVHVHRTDRKPQPEANVK